MSFFMLPVIVLFLLARRLPPWVWVRVLSPVAFLLGVTVVVLALDVCFQNCRVPWSTGVDLHRMSFSAWAIATACLLAGAAQIGFAGLLWRHRGSAVLPANHEARP